MPPPKCATGAYCRAPVSGTTVLPTDYSHLETSVREMASFIKEAKRGLRRRSGALLHSAIHHSPGWLSRSIAPALCYVEMLFVDYGIVRAVYNNRHRLSHDAWRSAQPAPHQIGWLSRRGVKTIVNLRGDQTFGTRWLQERACARHGLKLVNMTLRSRSAPTREELRAARALLTTVEYPILVHCKSGADRAGLMSVLVRHVHDGVPIEEARRQLALKYGHFRSADTGVLDAVFDRYVADNKRQPIEFWDWVETVYDPDALNKTFKANGWANRLVNGVLKRE